MNNKNARCTLFGLLVTGFILFSTSVSAVMPKVLSEADITRYKKIFIYQRALQTAKAASLTAELKKPLLVGHTTAEILLHPNTKSSYEDLSAWLSTYKKLPQASVISRLAKSRSPDALLTALIKTSASGASYTDPDVGKLPKGKMVAEIKDPKTKKQILGQLKRYYKKKQYLAAYRLLQKKKARSLLSETAWAKEATKLGRLLLNSGHLPQAEKLGLIAAKSPSKYQPDALWQSAFASYRLGKKGAAATTLRNLIHLINKETSHRARAAFWAGRIHTELGNADTAKYYYKMAAQNNTDFYGQLAQGLLPHHTQLRLWRPTANSQDITVLMSFDGAKRAVALTEIGEYALAQKELKALRKSLPYNMDETLLALSLDLNMPNAAFTLAHNLRQKGKLSLPGLYPVPKAWRATSTLNNADEALIWAIMRQESAFDPTIVSRAGARGLMQIMPATSDYILKKMEKPRISSHRLNRPMVSLDLGAYYINYLLTKLDDNLLYVISAYNGGIGNVRKWRDGNTIPNTDPLLFIESIPFKETRKYAKRVFANYWIYQRQLGEATPTLNAIGRGAWPVLISGASGTATMASK